MTYKDTKKERKMVIIPRATHLFEEPGTLDMLPVGLTTSFGSRNNSVSKEKPFIK